MKKELTPQQKKAFDSVKHYSTLPFGSTSKIIKALQETFGESAEDKSVDLEFALWRKGFKIVPVEKK